MINSILVVCVGNICRSPTGERLLQRNFPSLRIASAGLHALTGKSADDVAQSVALAHGLNLQGHSARPLTERLCSEADLILVMEKRHIDELVKRNPNVRGKVMLFGHWLGQKEIPDPYGQSREAFEHVYDLLTRSADSWLGKL